VTEEAGADEMTTRGNGTGAWLREWWTIIVFIAVMLVGWGATYGRMEARWMVWETRMEPVCERVTKLEDGLGKAAEDRRILEKKIDRLLIQAGIDPESIN